MNLVLTSSTQVATLVKNNPALQAIPALASLSALLSQNEAKQKSCCGKTTTVTDYTAVKTQIENALSSLAQSDYETIKKVLKIDKLCYYKAVNGSLQQVCV